MPRHQSDPVPLYSNTQFHACTMHPFLPLNRHMINIWTLFDEQYKHRHFTGCALRIVAVQRMYEQIF